MTTKLNSVLFICFCIFCFAQLAADDADNKLYVTADQVLYSENDILYLDTENKWRKASALAHDENGMFVVDPPRMWYCYLCQRDHWFACPRDEIGPGN